VFSSTPKGAIVVSETDMRKKAQKKRAKQDQAAEKKSTFSKYRGIGNPGIGPGRKGIDQWLRELRGPLN
jgi:hypothetical protein